MPLRSKRAIDRQKALEGLHEALRRGDPEGFRRSLRLWIGPQGLTRLSRKSGIPVRTLYRIRNGEGGARFDNVLRLLRLFEIDREA